jgi:PIN domain nuclease of toxin-antitoxin system
MRLLLDTHAFLWWVTDDDRLSAQARAAIGTPDNDVFLSAASAWEIITKSRIGRLPLHEPVDGFIGRHLEENAFQPLSISMRHAFELETLPDLHRDPFDRMLVAQALAEQMPLVTGDEAVRAYPVTTIW